MRRSLSIGGLAAAACLLSASVATATVMVPLSVEDLTHRSALVVRGRVLANQAAWGEQQRKIYTYTEIQVLSAVVAPGTAPQTIVVRSLGGEVGDVGMRVSGTPKFAEGEEVFLFLRVDPADDQQFQVVGMAQGKYTVERQGATVFAVPSSEGLAFVRPAADGLLKVSEHGKVEPRVALADLELRVKKAVQAGPAPTAPTAPNAPTAPTIPVTPKTNAVIAP